MVLFIIIAANFKEFVKSSGLWLPRPNSHSVTTILCGCSWVIVAITIMIAVERLAFKGIISKNMAACIMSVNIAMMFILPVHFVNIYKPRGPLAMIYAIWSLMMTLKMIGYVHFMYELQGVLPKILKYGAKVDRQTRKALRDDISRKNLEVVVDHIRDIASIVNLADVAYFFCAPILVYQLWYPRTGKVDWAYAGKLLIELYISYFSDLVLHQYALSTKPQRF